MPVIKINPSAVVKISRETGHTSKDHFRSHQHIHNGPDDQTTHQYDQMIVPSAKHDQMIVSSDKLDQMIVPSSKHDQMIVHSAKNDQMIDPCDLFDLDHRRCEEPVINHNLKGKNLSLFN